jgi:phospholipid-binding lipoprotein MlaA
MFVDLSKGAAPVAMPERSTSDPIRTPRTRHIDLSNGAPLPPDEEDDAPPVMAPEPNIVTITADRVADPYEEANRGRFRNHVRLHRYVIDPVERAYMFVVPVPARAGIHNFLTNLETPTVLANNLLKGEWGRAGDTLSRFVVNTTIGIGGIFDFAGDAGIPYRDDDFGATLANYGVGDAPYLLIPVIGPSNPRDLGGKVVDYILDPLHFVTLPGGIITSIGHTGFHELDKRSVDVGELDLLARTSPDAYAEERARAREERNAEINGTPPPPR